MKHNLSRAPLPLPRPGSVRTRQIAHWFGLTWPEESAADESQVDPTHLLPQPGEILFITGASGSGKSALLRRMKSLEGICWIDLDAIELPNCATIDCFADVSMKQALSLMSQVGLSEAWTYLRKPHELSEGQRWRLKLALALNQARRKRTSNSILVCDEFAAVLDRVTACVVAHLLRRAIHSPLRAVLVTSHDDLIDALKPDRVVRCDFGSVTFEHPVRRCAA